MMTTMFHIIDDDKFFLDTIFELLQLKEYESVSFNSPTKYIAFADSPDYQQPIAIFTDINMAEMSGYEMINHVSKIVPGLRFVVMSGEPEIWSEYIGKACMYLAKPFSPDKLFQVLDNLILCQTEKTTNDSNCVAIDDRNCFPLNRWICPKKKSD